MPRVITEDHPAVTRQEQIPARPGHVFEVSFETDESQVVQFFASLAMWKWIGWTYAQIPVPQRRKFEAAHVAHRLSPGLYRLPASLTLPNV